jgi:two-component system response regulator LytT
MKIVIIEDEAPAARRIISLIKTLEPDFEILASLDSIESAVKWFASNPQPDLALMDIELADGQSFEIFNQVKITAPVIFTTAYDEYALKAFQVNSIDYLLKPIEEILLRKALDKFSDLKKQLSSPAPVSVDIEKLIRSLSQPRQAKSRFLVKQGDRLISIEKDQIAYFMSEEKLCFLITYDQKKYVMDYTLDEIENLIDTKQFFRLNRKFIASIKAIGSIHNYFNGKLKLILKPEVKEEVIVSREKAPFFKEWLDF